MEECDVILMIDRMITILGQIVNHEASSKKTYSPLIKHSQRAIKNLSEIKIIFLRERKG